MKALGTKDAETERCADAADSLHACRYAFRLEKLLAVDFCLSLAEAPATNKPSLAAGCSNVGGIVARELQNAQVVHWKVTAPQTESLAESNLPAPLATLSIRRLSKSLG